MIKGCNIFLGQKVANTCSFVGGRIIVQQEEISTAERSWKNPMNALQEGIHYFFIKFCICCFSFWYEFFVHCALRVEKIINVVLMRDLWNFSFFDRGDVLSTHSTRCHSPGHISHNNFVKINCLLRPSGVLASCDSIFLLLRCKGSMEQNVHTTFSFRNSFRNTKNYSCGDVQRFCYHS